jgi:hypothetical protein
MAAVPADVFNGMFLDKLDSMDGKEKVAQYAGEYIRDHLREVAFVRNIIPPVNVTKNDAKPSVRHDTLVMVEEIEPQSRAMALNFRGSPDVRLIRAPRLEVPFFTISSERFEKYEQELLAYRMKITKVIEDNSIKDIQEIEDREFLIHAEAAVQALQTEANGGSAVDLHQTTIAAGTVVEASAAKGEFARVDTNNDAYVWPLQRPDVVKVHKLLDGNRLRCEKVLLTEVDFDDVNTWTVEDFGDKLQSETAVEGYKHNLLVGRGYVRTIKTDILKPGNVYGFTAPEFLGRFYILNQTKFYIDKVVNLITWQAWQDVAMSICNVAAVRKVELYSGSATSNTDSILADVSPAVEDDLGAMNNRVDDEVFFPQVNFY